MAPREAAPRGVRLAEPLAVVMASPGFLYQIEPIPDQHKRELTDLELAVRLAYFLWSSPPDEKLYSVARAGELKKPGVLAAQARRMIDDPRADEWIASFAHQWLGMERLDFFQFDFNQFPKKTEYSITKLGLKLAPLFKELSAFGDKL